MRTVFAILLLSLGGALGARTVAVSLEPQAGVARMIAGEDWEVIVALPPGVDHETYSPRPAQIRDLRRAEVFWASGMGFERLLVARLREARPELPVILPPEEDADEDHDHGEEAEGHDHADRHRWLDPALMAVDARGFAEALAQADPAHAADYAARAESFAAHCAGLRAELRAELAPYRGRSIFVFHAAYGHFAAMTGLKQVALEHDGREPSLRDLRGLLERARAAGARVVYVQPQHRPPSADAMARALGAELVSLDPLAADWEANLRRIAKQFASELSARENLPQ